MGSCASYLCLRSEVGGVCALVRLIIMCLVSPLFITDQHACGTVWRRRWGRYYPFECIVEELGLRPLAGNSDSVFAKVLWMHWA